MEFKEFKTIPCILECQTYVLNSLSPCLPVSMFTKY